MTHAVAMLVLDGVVGFDLGVPPQVFGAARTADNTPLYTVTTCGPGGRPVRPERGGFTVVPDHDLAPLATADTVLVPGVSGGPPLTDGTVTAEVAEVLLAAAGMLDGRRAASHWAWAKRLGRLYPRVEWDFEVLFVDDGDMLTSAGVAAGADLCLHVVRGDHGSAVANQAARRCVMPAWRDGGQAQYIERPIPAAHGNGTETTRAWALSRLAEQISLDELAGHARMSVRTFTRRFRDETGMSPQKWLLQQRMAHARLLLESTDLSVDVVARRSGLGSATALRQHFQHSVGVAPTAYRRAFRHP
ncbi:GlxA family transcriptional regulator [Actinoplanes sp. NPDC049681]|uniref:GlxA family transcriptional regulator n=1 Tax=Actinoplanes sp. NPDC049681 TaxID=3363905 RepID=UPI0037903320